MSQTHLLKTVNLWFYDVWTFSKSFEVRKNDRNFRAGDTLVLLEYDGRADTFLNRAIGVRVSRVWEGLPGMQPGFVILDFESQHNMPVYWAIDDSFGWSEAKIATEAYAAASRVLFKEEAACIFQQLIAVPPEQGCSYSPEHVSQVIQDYIQENAVPRQIAQQGVL